MKNFSKYFNTPSMTIDQLVEKFDSGMEMTNKDTDIVLLIDRSGSMHEGRDDSQGGINSFINDQKESEGSARITLVEFDDSINVVYHGNVSDCPNYTLNPGGMTALNDATGTSIDFLGKILDKSENKPGFVLFCIVTDGGENCSEEYTTESIKEMIKHQEDKYSWKFLYLGADFDAVSDSTSLGLSAASAVNFSKTNSSANYSMLSAKVSTARSATIAGDHEATMCAMEYTDSEREEIE